MNDVERLKDGAGALAEITMLHYNAYLQVGFSEYQAFELAKQIHQKIWSGT